MKKSKTADTCAIMPLNKEHSPSTKLRSITLSNTNGMELQMSNFGCTITSLLLPDTEGGKSDVVLGYGTMEAYNNDPYYMGSIIGRCSNRIDKGSFNLEGKKVQLSQNQAPHHLHGGYSGFNKKMWEVKEVSKSQAVLTYTSPAGEEGYPGTLTTTVSYTVKEDCSLEIQFTANADVPTLCSLTQHLYLNLAGAENFYISDHILKLPASYFQEVPEDLLLDPNPSAVEGSIFDFRIAKPLDPKGHSNLLKNTNGYDHNFLIDCDANEKQPHLMAQVHSPFAKKKLTIFSTMPCLQLYTANFLDGSLLEKSGVPLVQHGSFCLEPQFAPNAVNGDGTLKIPVLKPEETYRHTIEYKFENY